MCACCQKDAVVLALHMQVVCIFYTLKVATSSMHDGEKNSHGAVVVCSFSIVRVALWGLQSGSLFYLRRLLLFKMGLCALWLSPKWQPAAFSQSCCVSKMIVPFKKIKLVSSMVHAILKRCNPVLWGDNKKKKKISFCMVHPTRILSLIQDQSVFLLKKAP